MELQLSSDADVCTGGFISDVLSDLFWRLAMSFDARLLVPGEEAMLDRFLSPHTPFAFFMRSNLEKEGLRYEGRPCQADYFGAFKDGTLVGALAHSWLGNVQVFAEDLASIPSLVEAFRAHRAAVPRRIDAFNGPAEAVRVFWDSVGLPFEDLRLGLSKAGLFSLTLKDMVLPPLLSNGSVRLRSAEPQDAELLSLWRYHFYVEAGNAPADEKTREEATIDILRCLDEKALFVLEDGGELVASCGINGFLTDWVNVGPVWTPPEIRGRGYGRAVTAGALERARQCGRTQASLVAVRPDAEKIYRDIGFDRIGDWIFDFLKTPVDRL